MSNINGVPMVMVLLSYGMGLGVRTDGRTDSHVTTKIFEINGLPNFLRYGAPFAGFGRAGAPLLRNLRGSPPYFEKERLVSYDMSPG